MTVGSCRWSDILSRNTVGASSATHARISSQALGRFLAARALCYSAAVLAALGNVDVAHGQGLVSQMDWLSGCWENRTASGRILEIWYPENNGMMLGVSRAIPQSGTARELEQMRLLAAGDTLIYEAHPATQRRARFHASSPKGQIITFKNPQHDFPQQISYERRGGDSLIARIEGDRAGRRGPVVFEFARVRCDDMARPPSAWALEELRPLYAQLERAENEEFGAHLEWYGAHAGDGYRHVLWAAPGSDVRVRDAHALVQAAPQRHQSALGARANRAYTVSLDRVRARADTAEVLVTATHVWQFPDSTGRFGPAGEMVQRGGAQRWLDTWVRSGATWRLQQTLLISDVVTANGRTTVIDGVPVELSADDDLPEVVQLYLRAVEAADARAASSLFEREAVYEDVTFAYSVTGAASIERMLSSAFTTLRPSTRRILRVIANDSGAVIEWELTGTHSGPLLGVAATGRTIVVRAVSIITIREGRIARVTDYTDRARLEAQLR